ncbi:MAG: aminopeptidase [Firmicutes bacterium]|nr:aminopeptidase [Bacillota bacterium]
MRHVEMVKGARTLVDVCAGVRPGERVVVVTDTNKVLIAEVLVSLLVERGLDPIVLVMLPRQSHGQEPPQSVADAILNANVVFAPTTYSMSHSQARLAVCKSGGRFVSMPDYCEDMLVRGGLLADFVQQREVVLKVAQTLTTARCARITTEKGTDLTLCLDGREGRDQSAICTERGSFGSPPDIEAHIAPVEGTAEGVLVVDGSIPVPEVGVVREPVTLTVREGYIVNIEGGGEAESLKALLDSTVDRNVFAVGEFGIGLNPEARFIGCMLEDEGVFGTIHIGFGSNSTIGGRIRTVMHTDCVVKKPTVYLDGVTLIRDGHLV